MIYVVDACFTWNFTAHLIHLLVYCSLDSPPYASINYKREQPPGNFLGGQKPCPGANFPAKARPRGKKAPTNRHQLFLTNKQYVKNKHA